MPLVRYLLRRDTAANWTSANPTLYSGEPGIETDTRLVKYGDGITPWLDLPYSAFELPDVLIAYADGDMPSDFTLSIVDSPDGPAWLAAIGAQPASEELSDLAAVTPLADGDYTVSGVTISVTKGLVTDIEAVTPRATSVSVDTSVNPPIVTWQMPDVRGWATARVFRGTTNVAGSSVAVSDPGEGIGGLFAPMTFEDDALAAGTYWWWVRIYDAASNLLSTSTPATGTIT